MNPPPRRTDHAGKDAVAPLSFEDWQTRLRLPAVGAVGSNARLWVRHGLREARWPGNTDIAAGSPTSSSTTPCGTAERFPTAVSCCA